jgi:WS/DGAT/MGAT family acyltransferase
MKPVRIARGAAQISKGVRRGRRRRREEEHEPGRSFRAPRVSFNDSVDGTPHKALAFASLPVADVNRVKNTFGVTMNDVVLAACAGSLRHYLDGRNELPEEPLTVCAPVNVRTEDEHGVAGVHVSLMFTPIATDIEDPVERLREIHAGTSATKHVHAARGGGIMQTIVELPTPNVWVLLSRLIEAQHLGARLPPMFNACISNIVGPSETLYLGGARLLHHYILGMLYESIGLFIPFMSYADTIDIGITAVRELTPDPWPIADGIREALDELVKAAGEVG